MNLALVYPPRAHLDILDRIVAVQQGIFDPLILHAVRIGTDITLRRAVFIHIVARDPGHIELRRISLQVLTCRLIMCRICRIVAEQLLYEILILLRIPGTRLEAIAPAGGSSIHSCRTIILAVGVKKLHVNRTSLDLAFTHKLRDRGSACIRHEIVIVCIRSVGVATLHLERICHSMGSCLHILIVILAVGRIGAVGSSTPQR